MSDSYTTSTTGAYRLHAPAYQVFDPSKLEELYAAQVLTPGVGGLALGLGMGAQADRRGAAQDYSLALNALNAQQSDIARRRIAGDERQAAYSLTGKILEHPDMASALSLTRPLIAPEGADPMTGLTRAAVAERDARARNQGASALQAAGVAGVSMPTGATVGPYFEPSVPPVQGEPPSVTEARLRATSGEGSGASLGLRAAQSFADIPRYESEAYLGVLKASLDARGVRYDNTGKILEPSKLTAEETAQIYAEARATARTMAERMSSFLEQGLRNNGQGGLVPQVNPYRLNASPAPSDAAPAGDNALLTPPPANGLVGAPGSWPQLTNTGPFGAAAATPPPATTPLPRREGNTVVVPPSTTRPPDAALARSAARAPAPLPPTADDEKLIAGFRTAGWSDAPAALAHAKRIARSIRGAYTMQVMTDGLHVQDRNGKTLQVIPRE